MRVLCQIAGKCLSLLIFIVLAQLLAHAAVFAVDACYAALHKWFGNAFPLYSPIADREQYDAFRAVIDLISYAIALYFSVYLSIMISNKPNENLIKETDGFYTARVISKTEREGAKHTPEVEVQMREIKTRLREDEGYTFKGTKSPKTANTICHSHLSNKTGN